MISMPPVSPISDSLAALRAPLRRMRVLLLLALCYATWALFNPLSQPARIAACVDEVGADAAPENAEINADEVEARVTSAALCRVEAEKSDAIYYQARPKAPDFLQIL